MLSTSLRVERPRGQCCPQVRCPEAIGPKLLTLPPARSFSSSSPRVKAAGDRRSMAGRSTRGRGKAKRGRRHRWRHQRWQHQRWRLPQHARAVLHQNKDISEAGKGDRCGGRDLGQGKQQERVQRRAAKQLSISYPSGEALQLRSGWCCVGGRPGLKNLPSVLAEGCRGTPSPQRGGEGPSTRSKD